MTLDVKGVVDRRVDIQEALRRAGGFETLLFPLSSSARLMRVLRTIVRPLIIDVLSRQAEGSNCDVIGPEFIGAVSEQNLLSRKGAFHNLRRYTIPSVNR
jgi:hypothetical protein